MSRYFDGIDVVPPGRPGPRGWARKRWTVRMDGKLACDPMTGRIARFRTVDGAERLAAKLAWMSPWRNSFRRQP